MGTNIYGSYDSLVIELSGLDALRAGRREVRVTIDDVLQVRSADVGDLVTWDGERVLRLGRRRGRRVLVLDLAGAASCDRVVVACDDADATAEELQRWGIGAAGRPLASPTPALVA